MVTWRKYKLRTRDKYGKEWKNKREITALRVIVQGLAEGSINATRVDINQMGKLQAQLNQKSL